jgi:hypothetical protein
VTSRRSFTILLIGTLLLAVILPPMSLAACALVLSSALLVDVAAVALRSDAPRGDQQQLALLAVALLRAPPVRF